MLRHVGVTHYTGSRYQLSERGRRFLISFVDTRNPLTDHDWLYIACGLWGSGETGYSIPYHKNQQEDLKDFYILMNVIKACRDKLPIWSASQRFNLLVPMRSMTLWFPTQCLGQLGSDPGKLLLTAYVYAVSLVLSLVFLI